ncbi:MAG: proW [Acidimicrobiales bacterium]|nr:proW [Acidimicrobiales bacterium]
MTGPLLPARVAELVPAEPTNVFEWFQQRSLRASTGPIPDQMWLTLWHSLAAVAIAVAVAVPLAVVLAHYRRAEALSAAVVNLGRVIPTTAIVGVAVLVSLRNGFGYEPWPIISALVLLGLPPIFANTYTAVRGVDPDAVGAARAMGFTERRIMRAIELPLGAAVILTGIRVALVQLVATEAIGSYFGGEGLGAYVRQGFATGSIYQIQAGALLVAGLATACDFVLWVATRPFAQPGSARRARRANTIDVQPTRRATT